MATVTDGRKTGQEAAPSPDAVAPIDTTHVLRVGMVHGGRTVRRLTIEFDGGTMTAELPDAADGEDATDAVSVSRRETRIVATLAGSPAPMTRKRLSVLIKLKSYRGTFGGAVSKLLDTGAIFERDDLLTDDATKFDDDD